MGSAAQTLGVSAQTLRKGEARGEWLPARKTKSGTRYDAVADRMGCRDPDAPTVRYARASRHDPKADGERPHAAREADCAAKGGVLPSSKTLAAV